MIDLGVGIESILPWLEAGGVVALVAIASRFYIENRRLRLQERTGDREGYRVLIDTFQATVGRLEERCERLEAKHSKCEEDLSEMRHQLDGVHRQLVLHSSTSAVALGRPSEAVVGAAERAVVAVATQISEAKPSRQSSKRDSGE